jgi:hypothetical protein
MANLFGYKNGQSSNAQRSNKKQNFQQQKTQPTIIYQTKVQQLPNPILTNKQKQ